MKLDKPILLRSEPRRRQGPSGTRGSAVLVVLALGVANYMLFFQPAPEVSTPPLEQRLYAPGQQDSTPAARRTAEGRHPEECSGEADRHRERQS